jgi:bacteriocin-like protein
MNELNEQELEQVQGGSFATGTGAGASGAILGFSTDHSNVYTHTTPFSATSDASNSGTAAGFGVGVLSGATATSATPSFFL